MKYPRIAEDKSQLEAFKNETDAKIAELEAKPSGTKLYKHELALVVTEGGTSTTRNVIVIMISTDATANTSYSGGPAHLDKTKFNTVVSCFAAGMHCTVDMLGADDYAAFNMLNYDASKFYNVTSLTSDTVTEL